METISPPLDRETCATNVAGNIVWDTTQVGRTIERLCSQADPQLLGFLSNVRRTCKTGGVWGDPDFSECTLSRQTNGSNAFLLVWFVVQSDSVATVNNRRRLLEKEVRYLSCMTTIYHVVVFGLLIACVLSYPLCLCVGLHRQEHLNVFCCISTCSHYNILLTVVIIISYIPC